MTATLHPSTATVSTDPDVASAAARRLRLVLGANAATSTFAGLVSAFASAWVADRFGAVDPAIVRTVGVGLLAFAAATAFVAVGRAARLRTGTLAVTVGDVAWVAATPVVLATTDLATFGWVTAVVVAVGVADFAIAQTWLRHRLPRD